MRKHMPPLPQPPEDHLPEQDRESGQAGDRAAADRTDPAPAGDFPEKINADLQDDMKIVLLKKRLAEMARHNKVTHWLKIVFILGTLLMVNLAIIISFYLVALQKPLQFALSFNDYVSTIPLLLGFCLLYIDYLKMTQFYRKTYTDIFSSSVVFSFLAVMSTTAIAFFFRWFLLSRYVMVVASLVMVLLIYLWSAVCLYISKRIYPHGKLLLVAVNKQEADLLYAKVEQELPGLHLDYIGYALTADQPLPCLLPAVDRCTDVMVSASINETLKAELLLYASDHDKTIFMVPQFSDLIYSKFRVLNFSDMPTFMIDSLGLTYQQRVFKRLFDILFSLFVLMLTLPLQLVIAIAIRLDSPGPALYTQERATLSGRLYQVYKFRTMVNRAEERFGARLSGSDDPRVTRLGKLLRGTRLDELPQFFNILKGDMSVVGPRPERAHLISEYESNVPGFAQRLKVKSGLTGLAQVYGKYDTKPEDKLRYDIMYIRNYSLLLDIRIILLTVRVMSPANLYLKYRPVQNFPIDLSDVKGKGCQPEPETGEVRPAI